jgi:hypothetical protein
MPFDETVFLAGVLGAFTIFGIVLAWVSIEDARYRKQKS